VTRICHYHSDASASRAIAGTGVLNAQPDFASVRSRIESVADQVREYLAQVVIKAVQFFAGLVFSLDRYRITVSTDANSPNHSSSIVSRVFIGLVPENAPGSTNAIGCISRRKSTWTVSRQVAP